ncbi:unnamed protein product [Ascophyllum nodosum]
MELGKPCGDGSNDVGALRRSHVGLALLSGFGDANTNQMASFEPELEETKGLAVKSAKQVRKEEQERVQADITKEFERLRGEGVSAANAIWKASQKARKKRVESRSESPFAASAAAMFKESEGAEDGVRAGDASLAAPFTSKKPSIAAVLDVVRQGRCTLAAVLHTYQMVALHALFSSYTNSVLYLMRVRWPTRPLIATSFMFQPLHLALASPRALPDLSPLRPPPSVFHPSTFASLLGQAGVHVACMAFAVTVAKAHSHKDPPPPPRGGLLRHDFVPSLVSNVVFLVSQTQAVSVSMVNFKGRPFMRGILESRAIFLPAVSIVAFAFALALELVPAANKVSLDLLQMPALSVFHVSCSNNTRCVGRTMLPSTLRLSNTVRTESLAFWPYTRPYQPFQRRTLVRVHFTAGCVKTHAAAPVGPVSFYGREDPCAAGDDGIALRTAPGRQNLRQTL